MTTISQRAKQSERTKDKNDKTLMTATNHKQLWLPDEVETALRLAGEEKPEIIAAEIGRSYHGLLKKAEALGVSLALDKDKNNGNGHEPVKPETRIRVKVHKVIYTPVYGYVKVSGQTKRIVIRQKRKETTIFKYADEGEK